MKDAPMLFAHQLKAKTQAAPQTAALITLDIVRDMATRAAEAGRTNCQLDNNHHGSFSECIPTNPEVLALIKKALDSDGFTQVIVAPRCIAISWQ